MEGPGRYDSLATQARVMSKAAAIVLIVVDGNKGSGFAVQSLTPEFLEKLPKMLRDMALEIEVDVAHRKGKLTPDAPQSENPK